jgi:hypothetical protein
MLHQLPSQPVPRAETKHQRFLRLMHRRLERALNELRLVSQLSSPTYENTQEEAEEVVTHLAEAVGRVAEAFEVEYKALIGGKTNVLPTPLSKAHAIDEVDIMKAMELAKTGSNQEVHAFLKNLLIQTR